MRGNPRQTMERLFETAIAAARPATCLPPLLPEPPKGRLIVLAAGKAAASMAAAAEAHYDTPLQGLALTRYGHAVLCRHIEVIEAAHPVPDAAGLAGAQKLLDLAHDAGADDLVLVLISGGASALLSLPAGPVSLDMLRGVTADLLKSGADIGAMNCVRKHLSAITGGRLAAAAAPAKVVTLAISDVAGDDPATIGSGPSVPDPTTRDGAAEILRRFHIAVPDEVTTWLADPASESPKPGEAVFEAAEFAIAASGRSALDAAADAAIKAGWGVVDLGARVEGEARVVAADHARLARLQLASGKPHAILSGGETTVTISGEGRGGRNTEYLLALARELEGTPGIWALAGDTDGIDGTEENAGAVIAPDTLARAAADGLDARAALATHDSYGFFAALGDLVITGPTFTNVNDFRVMLTAAS